MSTVWGLYLDADDAAVLLSAVAVLERHRAVREPLPLDDVASLLDRLVLISRIAEQDVVYWGREAEDRREEASVDGGRWGAPAFAATMMDTALELAESSRRIGEAARAATEDLRMRIVELAPDGLDVAVERDEDPPRDS